MSFSDFKIIRHTGYTDNGTAILHSTLTNPLTGAGDFCRGFAGNLLSSQQEAFTFSVSSSYNAGSLINIPQTKSISVRAKIYVSSGTGIANPSGPIGVFCKANDSLRIRNHPYEGGDLSAVGYYFGTNYEGPYLQFVHGGYQGSVTTNTIISVPKFTWLSLRLDVIPSTIQQLISGSVTTVLYKDIVNCYTGSGSPGSETWGLIFTKDILTTDGAYVPWGSYTKSGTTYTSSVGFSVDTRSWYTNSTSRLYIDKFEARTENV